jgi:hypothetical protein
MATKTLDYSKLRETKVTIPFVALLGFIWLGFNAKDLTVSALSNFFLSKADAQEQYKIVTEQVTKTRTLIVTHINEYKINENGKETRSIANEMYNLELYVAANGDSQLTRDRKRDLANQLARLGRVRACVIRNAQIQNGNREPENCDAIF